MAIKGFASTVCESLLLHGIVIVSHCPIWSVIYVLYVIMLQKRHMSCHIYTYICSNVLNCFCIDVFAKSKRFGRHRYGSMTTMWWSWNLQTAGKFWWHREKVCWWRSAPRLDKWGLTTQRVLFWFRMKHVHGDTSEACCGLTPPSKKTQLCQWKVFH